MKVNRELLNRTRLIQGLNQAALARKSNLPIFTVRGLLVGSNSSPAKVNKLAAALGLKLEDVWID